MKAMEFKTLRKRFDNCLFARGGVNEGGLWVLQTPSGTLRVSLDADHTILTTIYCRFEEPGRAVASTGGRYSTVNPFSGKWNHHYSKTITVEQVINDFSAELDCVMNPKAVQA